MHMEMESKKDGKDWGTHPPRSQKHTFVWEHFSCVGALKTIVFILFPDQKSLLLAQPPSRPTARQAHVGVRTRGNGPGMGREGIPGVPRRLFENPG